METQNTSWIEPTLNNGWKNVVAAAGEPAQSTCAYRIVGDYVELKGRVTAVYGYDASMFILPEGARPNTMRYYIVDSSVGATTLRIYPDGRIIVDQPSNVSMDCIRFSLT